MSGCNFLPLQFLRVTINPGTAQNPGNPCAGAPIPNQGAPGTAVAPAGNSCSWTNPGESDPPDTTAGGGFASGRADQQGCYDRMVTIPSNLSPGDYEVCGVTTGLETVCATLRLVNSGSGVAGTGFARTGLDLLPWVIGALLAIAVGRYLVKRGRRSTA